LNGSGVVLSLDAWCADALSAINFRSDLLESVAKRFLLENIGISMPQSMVVMHNDRPVYQPPPKSLVGS